MRAEGAAQKYAVPPSRIPLSLIFLPPIPQNAAADTYGMAAYFFSIQAKNGVNSGVFNHSGNVASVSVRLVGFEQHTAHYSA
jgi:hypothetical protein